MRQEWLEKKKENFYLFNYTKMREITLNDLQLQDSLMGVTTRGFKEKIGTDELWVRVHGDKTNLLVSINYSLGSDYANSPCILSTNISRVKDDKTAIKIINEALELLMIQREGFYNITVNNEVHYK